MNVPLRILREVEDYAYSRGLPIIGPEKGAILVETVRKLKPKLVLELGTLIGYSTILIGKEMSKGSKIITIEKDHNEVVIAKRNIELAEINPNIEFLVGYAKELISKLNECFDFVFMDADHSEFMPYLELLEKGKKIRSGTVIFADNVGIFEGLLEDYLDHVRKSGLYESEFIRVKSDGVEISKKL